MSRWIHLLGLLLAALLGGLTQHAKRRTRRHRKTDRYPDD